MAIEKAVIDSNVLLALIDKKDKWHTAASALAKALMEAGWDVIYLDCVLNEVISVLGRRLEERGELRSFVSLLDKLQKIVPEKTIEWLYPYVPEHYSKILHLIKENEGKLNFHDALIYFFMQEQRVDIIVSFDGDFDALTGIRRISSKNEVD